MRNWNPQSGFGAVEVRNETSANIDASLPKSAQILVHGRVWCLEPGFQATAMEALEGVTIAEAFRLQAEFEAAEAAKNALLPQEKSGEAPPKPYAMDGSTALITVSGLMTRKPTSASYMMGGTSTIRKCAELRAARKDPDVKQILMHFDQTPGGEAAGCAEFADEVRETNAVKPVIGFISEQCASAGMFPASQCSALYMNRMGRVGCVSTLWVVHDTSARAAMQGVTVIPYVSEGGIYKGMLTPGTKLTPQQSAQIQKEVNDYGDDFKATVQSGRGLSDEAMKEVITAKMFNSSEALELGLIDGILSYEECLSQVSAGKFELPASSAKDTDGPSVANGDPMKTEDIMAWWRGLSPAARKESGLNIEEVKQQQQADLDAKVAERLTGIASSNAKAEAVQFATELIKAGKATHSEMDGIVSLYVEALSADGGGSPAFDGEKLKEGTNIAAVKAAYAKRPKSEFLDQKLGDLSDNPLFFAGGNGGTQVITKDRMRELLGYTEEGRRAFARWEASQGANN